MKLELNVLKKEFVKNGEKIPYTAFEVELEGEKFNLVPRDEDKRLIKHLLEEKEKREKSSSYDQLSIPGVKK